MADTLAQKNNELGQLGLPPMELAETNENGRSASYKCLSPLIHKIMALLLIAMCALGIYILILTLLQSDDSIQNTEIILVTGLNDPENISIVQDDVKIYFHLRNRTINQISGVKRSKRESTQHHTNHLTNNSILRVRKIILEHNRICNENKNKEVCKNLITKIKNITESMRDKNNDTIKDDLLNDDNNYTVSNYYHKNDMSKSEKPKREIYSQINERNNNYQDLSDHQLFFVPRKYHSAHQYLYPPEIPPLQNHEGCIHDASDTSINTDYSHDFSPYHMQRNFLHSTQKKNYQYRNEEPELLHKQKVHPQDIAIALSFLQEKTDVPFNKDLNTTIRDVECPPDSVSCEIGNACINKNKWCDGKVDCSDVSDEARCGCKSRVDKARICDFYFDCPFGEDEMGCHGCEENMFSCGDVEINSRGSCFTKDQRCNNVVDCPNQKDELDCSMLAPSLHKKPLFAVSNTEGYLHRNFKGTWYAVCENPYIWAHDACRREVGLVIGPPRIQYVPNDPMFKIKYLNTSPGGLIRMTDTCFNNSAAYVICSDIPCGTRVLTKSQLIHENTAIEDHLFGRNKRFFSQHPYPYNAYFRKRFKRYEADNYLKVNNIRNKRTEGRVVGGTPSQPAAWPWMIALYRDGTFHCGGVIISHYWIMSAAHCVHKFWDHYYEIQVGMLRRFSFSPQEKNHRVTHIIVNKNYNREDMKNDLSLLKVKPAILFSRWVRPICLPSLSTAGSDWMWGPAPETMCTAVGWGATVEHGPDPDHMREVNVPVWKHCKHQEDEAGKEICAGLLDGGRDACQGDSGGPLLCRNPINSQQWYIAGIVSHGDGCARKNEPGVYTRVSIFVKWIKYQITSTSLPVIQPKQECPGFRCESGISKCLPRKRKCDKIIDCLGGEDEINCDFQNSDILSENFRQTTKIYDVETNNFFRELSEISEITRNNNETTITIPTNPTSSINTESTISITVTEQNSNIVNKNSTEREIEFATFAKKHYSSKDTTSKDSTVTKLPVFNFEDEFRQVSTTEVSIFDDSDEGVTDSIEIVTSTPVTSNPISGSTEIDPEFVKITDPHKDLESIPSFAQITLGESSSTTNLDLSSTTQSILAVPDTHSTADIIIIDSTTNNDFNVETTSTNPNIEKLNDNINSATNSNHLIINFLPTEKNNNQLSQKTNETENIAHVHSSDVKSEVKELPDIDINKIEEIVMSDLQPANIRKKHKIPDDFQCLRIFQTIPYDNRCDRKADCEDGSDEFGCTCIDYLTTFDKTLICDGNLDCSEGEDENDCSSCGEGQFLCKQSEICLPAKHVCDGIMQCPRGEDEFDCYALTNGMEVEYDFDGKPKVKLEGYLTKKHNNDWHILCEDNLSIPQQEKAANDICRYLGFSSSNRYFVKYVNIREDATIEGSSEDSKTKRNADIKTSVKFTYRNINDNQHRIINEPEILKEHCVPNITKVCMSLFVFCDSALFTDFDIAKENFVSRETATDTVYMWPWTAKIFVDGDYKCTGVLLDVSWVVINHSCLKDSLFSQHHLLVILGSHKTLSSTNGPYEQIFQVDIRKDLYLHQVILLHLTGTVQYSTMVKPMIMLSSNHQEDENADCLAIGENNNQSITMFLKETNVNCKSYHRCFIRQSNSSICERGTVSNREWSGIISCHSKYGWYPAASFTDHRGECGVVDRIISTDIGNLKFELKHSTGDILLNASKEDVFNNCGGVRCSRGRCIPLRQVCDGIRDCEDGFDESEKACEKKNNLCAKDPYDRGCECPVGSLKCHNGRCILKELFGNGRDDCGDGSDEPGETTCSKYLRRVMPSRICDGILHCHDRSDEDPSYCKCFAKRVFKCNKSSFIEDYCVASDMVCDGVIDCPKGEDENKCIGLSAPQGTPYGTGKVIIRAHGVWYTKCYPTQNHTKSGLEAICRELGFISGHAKQLQAPSRSIAYPHNSVHVDPFSEVLLNNNTVIKLRNTHLPLAKAIIDENVEKCYPVFIECL